MSNNNAVVSDNAIAQTTMQSEDTQQTEDMQHEDMQQAIESLTDAAQQVIESMVGTELMVDAITTLFDSALQQLIAIRDSAYAKATEGFDRELQALAEEYDLLEEGIKAIQAILPAKTRLIQYEVDVLLVNGGSKEDAANKLAELAEVKRKPVVMRQRQKEIIAGTEAIQAEKRGVAKQVFETWYTKVRPVIRSAERGLLITLLQGLEQSFYQYQASTGMGISDNRHRPLVHQGHITGLTADGRSAEWAAGHKWYG